MIFLYVFCLFCLLFCYSVYLSLLYLVDVSQMAIFVETEVIILLFMGVVTFSCCIMLYLIIRLVSGVGF